MELKDKIEQSIRMIKTGERLSLQLNPDGYFVGFSGGKDSQVLLELVKMSGVKYKVFYSVTTNDPPENVYFIREHYPEVIFLHPKKNFFKLVEERGLPTMRRRYCCEILKEGAGAGSVVLTGVRAEESRKRAGYNEVKVISKRKEHADRSRKRTIEEIEQNEHRCIKGKDKLMIYPILHWTEAEVWQFIRERELPVNPCYEHGGRIGCMFCPFTRIKQLEYYCEKYPKFKERILQSLQKFIDRPNHKSYWDNSEDYFNWWKSKVSVKDYKAKMRQLKMEI